MKPYMPKFTAPKPAPKEEFRLGLASVSFRNNTQREILEAMRGAGLTHIEWGSDLHAPHKSLTMLAELAEMQKQYGIVCSSYGTYFRLGENSSEDLLDYIKAAKLLGTRVLRVWAGRRCGAVLTLPETEKFMHACEDAAEIAEAENVKICLECHLNTFTERLEDTLCLWITWGRSTLECTGSRLKISHARKISIILKRLSPTLKTFTCLIVTDTAGILSQMLSRTGEYTYQPFQDRELCFLNLCRTTFSPLCPERQTPFER